MRNVDASALVRSGSGVATPIAFPRARPRIGVLAGDAGGIGPELVARLLDDPETSARADILLIGDRPVFESGLSVARSAMRLPESTAPDDWEGGTGLLETRFFDGAAIPQAAATAAGGRATLRCFELALDLAREGAIDAVLFGPFNKEALHAGGMGQEDELRYAAAYLSHRGHVNELNTVDGIWTSRVTSHIPLKNVAQSIDIAGIVKSTRLVSETLRAAGVERPRIGVSALNPHAGDGGNFGREEIEVIAPAVAQLRDLQIDARGPFPSDTIFLKARDGALDGIVMMYHDQGQIAIKLMGFERGVTVLGGLPIPVGTPAHGTAYDIAGKGVANPGAMMAAFRIVCRMGAARRAAA